MYLPDKDHVMRYVPFARLRKDEDGNVIGFLPQAFELRLNEKELSVNWLEYFGDNHQENIQSSVGVFRKTIKVGGKSAFGIGNVLRIKNACIAGGAPKVRILHDPEPNNRAHAIITHLPRDDFALLESLADEVFEVA